MRARCLREADRDRARAGRIRPAAGCAAQLADAGSTTPSSRSAPSSAATRRTSTTSRASARRARARRDGNRRARRLRRADDRHASSRRSSAPGRRPATRVRMRPVAAIELANLLRRLNERAATMSSTRTVQRARGSRARSIARKLAMQALYQWQLTQQSCCGDHEAVRGPARISRRRRSRVLRRAASASHLRRQRAASTTR